MSTPNDYSGHLIQFLSGQIQQAREGAEHASESIDDGAMNAELYNIVELLDDALRRSNDLFAIQQGASNINSYEDYVDMLDDDVHEARQSMFPRTLAYHGDPL